VDHSSPQQREPGPAVHLAFEYLQPMHLTFHQTITPRHPHDRADRHGLLHAEGNLTSKTDTTNDHVTTYAYDHRNRLIGVTEKYDTDAVVMQATYTYDALDRRIATEVDLDGAGPNDPVTRWTVYDGQNPYADVDGSGNFNMRYLYAPAVDALLARTDSTEATSWYLPDRLGTIRDVVNTAGTVTYHAAYDGFGSITSETGTGGDRFAAGASPQAAETLRGSSVRPRRRGLASEAPATRFRHVSVFNSWLIR